MKALIKRTIVLLALITTFFAKGESNDRLRDYVVSQDLGDTIFGTITDVKKYRALKQISILITDTAGKSHYFNDEEISGYYIHGKEYVRLRDPINPDSCYYILNKKDDFTGEIKKSVEAKTNTPGSFILKKVGANFYIQLIYHADGAMVCGPENALLIKLDNDSVLQFFPDRIYTCEIGRYGNTLRANYYCSIDNVSKLIEHQPTKYRVYLTDSFLEKEIDPRYRGTISRAMTCLLK